MQSQVGWRFSLMAVGVTVAIVAAVTLRTRPLQPTTPVTNLRAVKTALMIYARSSKGQVPESLERLETVARQGGYWPALANPFSDDNPACVPVPSQEPPSRHVPGAVGYMVDPETNRYYLVAWGPDGALLRDGRGPVMESNNAELVTWVRDTNLVTHLQFENLTWHEPEAAVLAKLGRRYEYQGRSAEGWHRFHGTFWGAADCVLEPSFQGGRFYRIDVHLPPANPAAETQVSQRAYAEYGAPATVSAMTDHRYVWRILTAWHQLTLPMWTRILESPAIFIANKTEARWPFHQGELRLNSREIMAGLGHPQGMTAVFQVQYPLPVLRGRGVRVVAPNEVIVKLADRQERVRLIGLANLGDWVQGALPLAKSRLEGKDLLLVLDERERDAEKRLWSYVYTGAANAVPVPSDHLGGLIGPDHTVEGGRLVNAEMIEKGMAVHVSQGPNMTEFTSLEWAQDEARKHSLGIWDVGL